MRKTAVAEVEHALDGNRATATRSSRGSTRSAPAPDGGGRVKFGIFYEHQLPRPWDDDSEYQLIQDALEQIELADTLGIEYVWEVEHHFLEEYSHSSAPEVFLAAASQRTKRIRLGHGIVQTPPPFNHPARVAERIAMLDLVSDGRVDFGTGESSSEAELGGFVIDPEREARDVGGGPARRGALHDRGRRSPGHAGEYVTMPPRNVVPKPRQKPHPPRLGRVQPARHDPPRGAEGDRRARVRVRRSRRGAALGRRLLRRRSRREGVPIGDAVNAERRVRHHVHVPRRRGRRRSRRGLEGANFFGYSLAHYYVFGRHQPGAHRRVGRVPAAAGRARLRPRGGRGRGRRTRTGSARRSSRRASAGCAARSARPTRSASTCGATRSAASTR